MFKFKFKLLLMGTIPCKRILIPHSLPRFQLVEGLALQYPVLHETSDHYGSLL